MSHANCGSAAFQCGKPLAYRHASFITLREAQPRVWELRARTGKASLTALRAAEPHPPTNRKTAGLAALRAGA